MYKEENNTNVPQTLTRRQKRVGSIGKKKKIKVKSQIIKKTKANTIEVVVKWKICE